MSEFLRVKNWEKFQHYKKREPPWIKLHRSILSDPEFISMPELAQYELIRVWLLASCGKGLVSSRQSLVKQMTGLKRLRYWKLFIKRGFLFEGASTLLASCKQSADPETETETETETDNPPTPLKGEIVSLPDWVPKEAWEGFLEFRKKARKPLTLRGVKLAIQNLEKLRRAGNDPTEVLNQSVLRGWTGLFEVRTQVSHVESISHLESI